MTYVRHPRPRPVGVRLAATDARVLAERILAAIPPEPPDVIAERRAVLAGIGTRPAPQLTFVVSADSAVAVTDRPSLVCDCRGSGWVCEAHQWVPFAVDAQFACPCDAPGAPCPMCSRLHPAHAARLLAGVTRTPKEPR